MRTDSNKFPLLLIATREAIKCGLQAMIADATLYLKLNDHLL
jgi:hypothetical protein